MKKIVYNQYGNFDQLQLVAVDIPKIQEDELLISVKAVAINPLDWKKLEGQLKIITGKKFPKGIAFDFSGVVEKVGNSENNYKVGDEVFGTLDAMKGEALAEYLAVKSETIYPKPNNVSFETAAAVLTGTTTAKLLLDKSKMKIGDSVLINGASGGVGMMALELATLKGFKATVVASGEGLNYIQKWNPAHSIDYKKENVVNLPLKYNAILELAGNLPYSKAKSLLAPNGIYLSTLPTPIDMLKSFFNNLVSSKKHIIIQAKPNQAILKETSELLAQNKIEIPIAKTFGIQEYKEAYQFAKNGRAVGKVVFLL